MNTIKIIIPVFLLFHALAADILAAGDDTGLFRDVIKEYSKIRTIDAEIDQEIWSNEVPPERYKGRYRAGGDGRFRVDYTSPDVQIVLNNGSKLYWYYPNEKILYEIASLKNEIAPKLNPLGEYAGKIDVRFKIRNLGMGLHGFFHVSAIYQLLDTEKGVNIIFWIDPENHVVLKKTVSDKNGKEYIREIYSDFKKLSGINYPSRIDVMVRTSAGVTGNTTFYRKVMLNKGIDTHLFMIDFPKDVKKRSLDEN